MSLDRNLLHRLCGLLLLLALATAPTQWSLRLAGGIHLTAADLLLAAAVPPALAAGWRPWRLHWSHLAFAALTLLSAFCAPDRRAAAREWVQIALYFLAGPGLADAALRRGGTAWLRRGLAIFLLSGALVTALALQQYWRGDPGDPLGVRGSFGNRNVLGGYFALLLPLASGLLPEASPRPLRAPHAALLLAGFTVMLSGPAWLAAALACTALATARGPARGAAVCALLLGGYLWLLPLLPRANDRELFASMALYDEIGRPTRRYPEWQAAAAMTFDHPWLGCGLGSYQRHIGRYYGAVPNPPGPAEPDIQNLYLVLSSSAGIPACLAFLAMLGSAAATAAGRENRRGQDAPPGTGAGTAAALAAFTLAAAWHPLLVRGIGLPLALLLAAARWNGEDDRQKKKATCS